MTTPPAHDDLGRLVQAFLAGEHASGLPRGAALEAFRRRHGLGADDLRDLRQILAVVERCERSKAAA